MESTVRHSWTQARIIYELSTPFAKSSTSHHLQASQGRKNFTFFKKIGQTRLSRLLPRVDPVPCNWVLRPLTRQAARSNSTSVSDRPETYLGVAKMVIFCRVPTQQIYLLRGTKKYSVQYYSEERKMIITR